MAYPFFTNSKYCPFVWVGTLQNHNYKKRNSCLSLVSACSCNFYIRKNIGKRLQALFLIAYNYKKDK
jgi:hypothetical protein